MKMIVKTVGRELLKKKHLRILGNYLSDKASFLL